MIHPLSQIRTIFWLAIGSISALFGAENWSSFDTIMLGKYVDPIPPGYYQDYTSLSSNSMPYICSGILYYNFPGDEIKPIGGFDVCNGWVINSYFSDVGEAYTANTGVGTNPNNSRYCYWEVYYDYNGEGILGTQSAGVIFDNAKLVDPTKYSITNFSPYGTTPATFEFRMIDPTVVLPFGAVAVNIAGANNLISLSVSTSDTSEPRLSLQYKDSLTNTIWQFLSIQEIPAFASSVSAVDTNTVPSRFYRAVVPR